MKTILPIIIVSGFLALTVTPVFAQAFAQPRARQLVQDFTGRPAPRLERVAAGLRDGHVMPKGAKPPASRLKEFVALDCHAIGQRKADDVGGQLAKATPVVKNGRDACQIVILIPAKNGNRPRRAEFVLFR